MLPTPAAPPPAVLPLPDGAAPSPAPIPPAGGLPREERWRQPDGTELGGAILITRWLDERSDQRWLRAEAPSDRQVIGVALRRGRMRLRAGREEVFDGTVTPGTVLLTAPSCAVEAEFRGPCDFVHFYVAPDALAEGLPLAGAGAVLRDDVSAHLARSLADELEPVDGAYGEAVARTVLLRLARLPRGGAGVSPLPKWRLRRVQQHVEANLEGPLGLDELAGVAGLSRSYFAAQFRAATGFRPHDYVSGQRIERAKALMLAGGVALVEVALSVGFQTQAHFSTVFKRHTGTSPARWKASQQQLA